MTRRPMEEESLTDRQQIHADLDALFEKHRFGTPGDAAAGLFFAVRTYVYGKLTPAAEALEAAQADVAAVAKLRKLAWMRNAKHSADDVVEHLDRVATANDAENMKSLPSKKMYSGVPARHLGLRVPVFWVASFS